MSSQPPAQTCDANTPCPTGSFCCSGTCQTPLKSQCSKDSDCSTTSKCMSCVNGACVGYVPTMQKYSIKNEYIGIAAIVILFLVLILSGWGIVATVMAMKDKTN